MSAVNVGKLLSKQCFFTHWKVHTREEPCECQEYVLSFTRRCYMIKYISVRSDWEMALWILQIFRWMLKFEVTQWEEPLSNDPFREETEAQRYWSPVCDLLRMDRDLGFHARLPGVAVSLLYCSPQVWDLKNILSTLTLLPRLPHTHVTDNMHPPHEPCFYTPASCSDWFPRSCPSSYIPPQESLLPCFMVDLLTVSKGVRHWRPENVQYISTWHGLQIFPTALTIAHLLPTLQRNVTMIDM